MILVALQVLQSFFLCKHTQFSLLIPGVTPGRRGEVWSFLIQQYQERHPSHPIHPSHPHTLTQLCQMGTDFENAIHMDLGKTSTLFFPPPNLNIL